MLHICTNVILHFKHTLLSSSSPFHPIPFALHADFIFRSKPFRRHFNAPHLSACVCVCVCFACIFYLLSVSHCVQYALKCQFSIHDTNVCTAAIAFAWIVHMEGNYCWAIEGIVAILIVLQCTHAIDSIVKVIVSEWVYGANLLRKQD